jgi:hypothetical protein
MDHANPSLSPEGWPVNLLAPRPATRDLGWGARREIERGFSNSHFGNSTAIGWDV